MPNPLLLLLSLLFFTQQSDCNIYNLKAILRNRNCILLFPFDIGIAKYVIVKKLYLQLKHNHTI